jgi:hypothetical protein
MSKTIQVETIKVKGSKNDAKRALYNWVQHSKISELIKVSYNLSQIEETHTPNPAYYTALIERNNYNQQFDKYLSDSSSLNPFVKAHEPEKLSYKAWFNSITPHFTKETQIWEVLIMYK